MDARQIYRGITPGQLWMLECVTVFFGLLFSFLAPVFFPLSACFLCVLARCLWGVYASVLLWAWWRDSSDRATVWDGRLLRGLRLLLLCIALVHIAVIHGWSHACPSPDLMRLRGGIWLILAAVLSLIFGHGGRSCAEDPLLWGWVSLPLIMIFFYIFWEFLDSCRRRRVYKGG